MKLTLVKHGCGIFCSKSCANYHRWDGRPNSYDILFKNIKIPDDNNLCWIYLGKIKRNYGSIYYDGRWLAAHRVSYKFHYGEIPDGLFVCHTCDVPACVNPKHLFLGTPLDNMRDKISKGRANYSLGSKTGSSKLNEDQVKEIKLLLKAKIPQNIIAEKYFVSDAAIYKIKTGKRWSHIVI